MSQFLPLLIAAVGLVGTGGGAWWVARLAWVRAFLARADAEARLVVLEVEQVYVDRVRAGRDPASPGGADLTPEEQAEALGRAVDRLAELLGLTTLERALRILGLPRAPAFLRGWLTTRVEAHVKLLSLSQGEP